VGNGDKADPDLRQTLERLGENETVEVLVYPAGGTDELLAYLTRRRDTGDLEFNVLELAGSIVLRARRGIINEVAARSDVARVTLNPRFTTNGTS
jgi:hypothetical protein